MRTLLFVVAIIAIFQGGAALAETSAGSQGYRLDIGDELRIKVFEWRSSVGDVHEWTALNGSYDVGADGEVAMPLLGALKAAGQTTDQLADTISTQLQTRFGLTIRPQASIEIIQYRPFYLLGDISKPGAYPYQPGLTVLQAISIAGGRYRVNDPALLLTTAGDLRVHRLEYEQLLARRARLEAELNDANAITFPQGLTREQNDPNIAQLIQREESIFATRRDAMSSQINALNQLKSLLNSEVASLQDKMKNMDQELGLMKEEVNNTSSLVQRGLAIAPREYSLRETELDTASRRLDLDTAALRAKEDIGKADESIIELRNKTRDQTQSDLADVEQKLSETAARIATGTMIVDREQSGATNPATAGDDAAAKCVILRREDGKTTQLQGNEASFVEPGDTITIQRAATETPVAGTSLSVADDAPPPQAVAPQAAVPQAAVPQAAVPQATVPQATAPQTAPARPAPKPGPVQHPAPSESRAGGRP
ncbi:MAG TPA: polysaccharide biosynthesis/export family protein [Stellaceae bacterium]|jgi:protein involved in polysaccharide export with SLBB domain|nr:polysaccharide biosynthesis/export family protein [Stellaceae bacterium]